ncbi:MAG: T9SS type A sorting domain-containing protein [Chitinophagales bacterium]
MKKITLFLTSLFIIHYSLFSQEPLIQWQNTIGGSGEDFLISSEQTMDGGYILGGYSISPVSGDKTEGILGGISIYYDYWIVKLNSTGIIEWQNTIGGEKMDWLSSVHQLADGNYIVGGTSTSWSYYDKTLPNHDLYGDYWIMKLDATGNIIWQRVYGGGSEDRLSDCIPVTGGGYIVAGSSKSGIGFEKTEGTMGSPYYDYWILKVNALGGIVWQNTIGGSDKDSLTSIIQTSDGGFLAGGYSRSPVSGDKTDPIIGTDIYTYDYWVVKLDGSGNIQWQKTIGGNRNDYLENINQTPDGGYVLIGNSNSPISGNRTLECYDGGWGLDFGTKDCWVVKLDASGNILWQKIIGGENEDVLQSSAKTADGGFICGMKSKSPIGEEKTENYTGGIIQYDYWILKLDANGNILWQNVLGGTLDETLGCVSSTADGGFFIGGSSKSFSGGDKTETNYGLNDYWVLKLGPQTGTPVEYFPDVDHDGFGDPLSSCFAYEPTPKFITTELDCNPINSHQNPAFDEICDGIDNNCDGSIDEGLVGCNPGPAFEWQKDYGGDKSDLARFAIPTADNGFLVGASSSSGMNGNKTEPSFGDYDYWILKLNASGNIEWQNTIGGTYGDYVTCAIQTDDGGYLIGGYSNSGITGDKTEPYLGGHDYWIIKLNSTGIIEWQKVYGGNLTDYLITMISTSDGGYLLAGYSESGISIYKTEANIGLYDYWVVKINNTGIIEWDNTYGGSLDDYLSSAIQTSDNGYLFGGSSRSNISDDKSEDRIGSYSDMWVIKTNNSGNIEWENTIGGNNTDGISDLAMTSDGNYFIAGISESGINHDKDVNLVGETDFWLLKLNSAGDIIWQKDIGGSDYESLADICPTIDGGFLLAGSSVSPISGDKSEPSFENPEFPDEDSDYWLVKLDADGEIQWQNSIGGDVDDELVSVEQTADGGIILNGQTNSGISGDKTEALKMESFAAFSDSWLIKLSGACFGTETCNTLDDDCNGLIDDGVVETINISAGGLTTFCQGGSILLTATYSGTSVQWKKNGTNIAGATASTYSVNKTGDYTCVTTSPCGTATSTLIHVTVNKNPTASITAGGATTFCAGGNVTLTEAAVAGSTYQWYKGAAAIGGATSTNYLATTAGNYKCRVTKTASGCFKNSNVITVTIPCREDNPANPANLVNPAFAIYPNPNNGTFTINYEAGSTSSFEGGIRGMTFLEVYNSLGQLIYSLQLCAASFGNSSNGNIYETISISEGSCGDNLSPGIYFVRINQADNYSEQKLIIN